MILYGIAPVHQAVLAGKRELKRLWVKEGKPSPKLRELRAAARTMGVRWEEAPADRLVKVAGHAHHQGVVLECGELPTEDVATWMESLGDKPALLVALDQIHDPQNVGAIIRSAAFLGATALLTLRSKSSPLTAVVSKASAGALEHFPIIEAGNLAESLRRLQEAGFWVAGAAMDPEAVSFRSYQRAPRQVLVLGNESEGLRSLTRKRCDTLLRIDGVESTESLNVSVAAGILLSHLSAKSGGEGGI